MLARENTQVLTDDLIERALVAIEETIHHAQEQVDHWHSELTRARQEQHLLKELLSLQQDGQIVSASKSGWNAGSGAKNKHPSVERSVDLLREAGRPLHISELMRLLRQDGIRVPGAGTQANLIAHLSRDERVIRPARGMYGLTEWGIELAVPRPKKKRRTRVRGQRVAQVIKEA